MGGLLSQLLSRHHEAKMQESKAQLDTNIYLVQQGMQGNVPPHIWQPAYEALLKHPAVKDHKEAIQGAMARIQQPQVQPAPIPSVAGPGQTPGTAMQPAPAAQPTSNPIQASFGKPIHIPTVEETQSPEQRNAQQSGINLTQLMGRGMSTDEAAQLMPVLPPFVSSHPVEEPEQAGTNAEIPALPPVNITPQVATPQAAAPTPAPVQGTPAVPMPDQKAIYEKWHPAGVFQNPRDFNAAQKGFETEWTHAMNLWQTQAQHGEMLRQTRGIIGTLTPDEQKSGMLPASKRAELAALGVNLPTYGMASLMSPLSGGLTPGSAISAETDVEGNPIDRGGTAMYRPLLDKVTKKPVGYVLQGTPSTFGYDAEGNQRAVSKFTAPGQTTGNVAPSQLTNITGVGPSGQTEVTNRAALKSGKPPVATGLTPVGMLPTTTTVNTPGELPTTTHRVKSAPAGGARPSTRLPAGPATPTPSIPAVGGGGSASLPPGDPTTVAAYKAWVAGGPTPTGKGLKAVQTYADQHQLPQPNPLSAQGVKDVADIDTVLSQIQDLKTKMEQRGMHKDDTRNYYGEYVRYKNKQEYTPNNDIYTELAFTKLRSTATALKGTGSRAYPVFEEAMQHTPQPDPHLSITKPLTSRLAATPKSMYEKLSTMEGVLKRGRQKVLLDERKSGVISDVGGAPLNQPAPVVWTRDAQGRPVPQQP